MNDSSLAPSAGILSHLTFAVLIAFLQAAAQLPALDPSPVLDAGHGLFSNPALLSAEESSGFLLQSSDFTAADYRVFAGVHAWQHGLTWSRERNKLSSLDRSRWSLVSSFSLFDDLSFGDRITFSRDSRGISKWSWDPGFLYRPFPQLSLGWSSENLLQTGVRTGALQRFGVGVRPVGEWISLGWDATAPPGNRFSIATMRQFVSLRLLAPGSGFGFTYRQEFDRSGLLGSMSWTLGVSLNPVASMAYAPSTPDGRASLLISQRSSRSPAYVGPRKAVILDLGKKVSDRKPGFSLLGSQRVMTLSAILDELKWLQQDTHVREVVIKLAGLRCGPGTAREIRGALLSLRKSGRHVTAWLDGADNLSYYLASAADRIVLHPTGVFQVNGLAAEVLFFKGLFEKVGIEAQILRHGKFKSAVEPFTRDSLSAEAREDLSAYLGDLWQTLLEEVAISRGIKKDSLVQALKVSLMNTPKAVELGLVDTLLYADQLEDLLEYPLLARNSGNNQPVRNANWKNAPRFAEIGIQGAIVSGPGGTDRWSGTHFAGSSAFAEAVQSTLRDPDIHGILIRIDSPGGSGLASDDMWRSIQLARDKGLPVVVSIGNTAASGGYYAAVAGDWIVAEKTSLVGSIGVFGGKVVLRGLYEKIGLRKSVVKTSASADAHSDYRGFSKSETESLQEFMDRFYDTFITKVAEGRKLGKKGVDSLAQGRIYTGKQALANGLVDEIGDLNTARAKLLELAGFTRNSKARWIQAEPASSGLSALSAVFSLNNGPGTGFLKTLEGERVWAFMPLVLLW